MVSLTLLKIVHVESSHPSPARSSVGESATWTASYDAVTQIAIYEATSSWARINGMLVANSILAGGTLLMHTSDSPPAAVSGALTIALPALGAILSTAWLALEEMSRRFRRFWRDRGIDIESLYVPQDLRLFEPHDKAFPEGGYRGYVRVYFALALSFLILHLCILVAAVVG